MSLNSIVSVLVMLAHTEVSSSSAWKTANLCLCTDKNVRAAKTKGAFYSDEIYMQRLIQKISFASLDQVFYYGYSATVEDAQSRPPIWNTPCKWNGVHCDDESRVIELTWIYFKMRGEIDLAHLPPLVRLVSLEFNHLTGSHDFSGLPVALDKIRTEANRFACPVDLTSLPSSLTILCVSRNKHFGEVDLTTLPQRMTSLGLQRNEFSGSASLAFLPSTLAGIFLNNNNFSGELDLRTLPGSLLFLSAENNKFTRVSGLQNLPQNLILELNGNLFQGESW